MKLAIRRFHSPDVKDLPTWYPPDSVRFALLLQVMAGPQDQRGEESFDVVVISPSALGDRVATSGPIAGRHYLVVDQYDWSAIERYIHGVADRCEGEDWPAIAAQFGRLGKWEFEDYREFEG